MRDTLHMIIFYTINFVSGQTTLWWTLTYHLLFNFTICMIMLVITFSVNWRILGHFWRCIYQWFYFLSKCLMRLSCHVLQTTATLLSWIFSAGALWLSTCIVFLPLFTFTNTSHDIFHNEVDHHYECVCFCQSVVSRAVCFPGSSCGICCGFQWCSWDTTCSSGP